MKQALYTNAAEVLAAGVARPRPGRGICAYPWHLGDTRPGGTKAGMNAITESKLHFRWPGDPSS